MKIFILEVMDNIIKIIIIRNGRFICKFSSYMALSMMLNGILVLLKLKGNFRNHS